jgi:hypothetical protein
MNKLIILNGPSGAGKSTVARILWKKMGRTALVGLDEIKWLISDYKSDNHDLTLAGNIGLNMAEIFLVDGLDVIVEKAFCKQEYIQPFIDLADKLGIIFPDRIRDHFYVGHSSDIAGIYEAVSHSNSSDGCQNADDYDNNNQLDKSKPFFSSKYSPLHRCFLEDKFLNYIIQCSKIIC